MGMSTRSARLMIFRFFSILLRGTYVRATQKTNDEVRSKAAWGALVSVNSLPTGVRWQNTSLIVPSFLSRKHVKKKSAQHSILLKNLVLFWARLEFLSKTGCLLLKQIQYKMATFLPSSKHRVCNVELPNSGVLSRAAKVELSDATLVSLRAHMPPVWWCLLWSSNGLGKIPGPIQHGFPWLMYTYGPPYCLALVIRDVFRGQ